VLSDRLECAARPRRECSLDWIRPSLDEKRQLGSAHAVMFEAAPSTPRKHLIAQIGRI
jgi:hypothetical protein